jgi:post-segregation antitoxin (ccd killing protein)
MTEKKRVLNVTVGESIAKDVRTVAADRGVTISSVVEDALREHLKWERIRSEGIAAVTQYFDDHGWPTPAEEAESKAWVEEAERLLTDAHARAEARRIVVPPGASSAGDFA